MTSPNNYPTHEQATLMELDVHGWNDRIKELIAQDAHIIAFRGAGTVNGISLAAAEEAGAIISAYVKGLAKDGTTVALMYDGDEDNRDKPDVGSVFGSVVDSLKELPNVVAIAAQTKGWYYPKTEGGSLESATGTPYETYVFSDELPGAHAALTQSDSLVDYSGYEQIFIGPAGTIALDQLKDLSNKSAQRRKGADPVKVKVVRMPLNRELDQELQGKLASAPDEESKSKITAKISQRQAKPYGALFTPNGLFDVDPVEYPGLDFEVSIASGSIKF